MILTPKADSRAAITVRQSTVINNGAFFNIDKGYSAGATLTPEETRQIRDELNRILGESEPVASEPEAVFVMDQAGFDALPDGTRFSVALASHESSDSLAESPYSPKGRVNDDGARRSRLVRRVLNPEILGEFKPIEEPEPDYSKVVLVHQDLVGEVREESIDYPASVRRGVSGAGFRVVSGVDPDDFRYDPPKFKVGDWVRVRGDVFRVDEFEIDGRPYYYVDNNWWVEDQLEPWVPKLGEKVLVGLDRTRTVTGIELFSPEDDSVRVALDHGHTYRLDQIRPVLKDGS